MLGGEGKEAVSWYQTVHPRTRDPDWPARFAPVECVQHPGETVVVPGGWWHVVVNLDTTVAVTQNFASTTNFSSVWAKTVRGRPGLANTWLNELMVVRPDLATLAKKVMLNFNFIICCFYQYVHILGFPQLFEPFS